MSDDVDVRLTPSLHPEIVRQIDDFEDADVKPFLAPVETAFSQAYIDLASIHDAKAAAEKNPTLNAAGKLLAVDDLSAKKIGKLTRTFDSVRTGLGKTIASIETDLSKPVESKAALSVCQEIRAHAKALDTTERMNFVRQAIVEGDHTTATAVLGAPAYLSGLDAKTQAVMLRMYHEQHSPVQAKRLRALQSAKDLIERNGPLLLTEADKAVGYLTDPKTQRKIYPAELRSARDAAAKPFAS